MRTAILLLVAAVACTPRAKAPNPQLCRGDRKATVLNNLSVPVDVKMGGMVIGTVSAGGTGAFEVPRGQGVSAGPNASDYSRFGLTPDDRKKVIVGYACVDK